MRIRIRNQEHGNWPKLKNKPGFLPFKSVFVPLKLRFLTYNKLWVRYSTFCEYYVWPGSGSTLVGLPGSGSALRYKSASVSGSALKPMRIHNTLIKEWQQAAKPFSFTHNRDRHRTYVPRMASVHYYHTVPTYLRVYTSFHGATYLRLSVPVCIY